MKKQLFPILIFYLLLIPAFYSFAETKSDKLEYILKSYFNVTDSNELDALMKEKRIDNIPSEMKDFKYLPLIHEKFEIEQEIENISFTSAIESLFIIPAPSSGENPITRAFIVLTDLETMNGIKYYSASRQKDQVLFNEAYFVKDKKSGEKLYFKPPPVLKEDYSFTAFVHDNTFGKNFYYNNYKVSENYIIMKMGNLDRLTYGIIPVLKEDTLIFYMIIVPAGDNLVLYVSGTSKTFINDFIRAKINNSIYNRVTALYNWFSVNYK